MLATLTLTVGLTACGSDSEDPAERPETDPATRVTGQQGDEITPEKKAPDSAGDRKNAPDDVISERPGGPASPDSP